MAWLQIGLTALTLWALVVNLRAYRLWQRKSAEADAAVAAAASAYEDGVADGGRVVAQVLDRFRPWLECDTCGGAIDLVRPVHIQAEVDRPVVVRCADCAAL